jgi:hypothetical protein
MKLGNKKAPRERAGRLQDRRELIVEIPAVDAGSSGALRGLGGEWV